jgi:hypothetical protein
MELSENEAKRDKMTFGSFNNINSNGQTNIISSLNSNSLGTLGIIRSEELSKMFPTPPSIEQHTNSSPGPSNVCGSITDNLIENIDTIVSHKTDSYPNFGSPQEETIEVCISIIFLIYYYVFKNLIYFINFLGLVIRIYTTKNNKHCWIIKICSFK